MKLASYKDGTRDGQLVVVSRDLATAHYATGPATRLQQVLDDWNFLSPQLQVLSQNLNHGKSRHSFAFEPSRCMAPLPRAYAWLDGQGDAIHVDGPGPDDHDASARLRRGASDHFLPPRGRVFCREDDAMDVEAKLAVVLGDVDAGVTPESALDGVRLVMLAGDVVLRNRDTWTATAFAPLALTPDELAPGWQGGRLDFEVEVHRNGKRLGSCAAGGDMSPHFGELIAAAAVRRRLEAGSIIGGGKIGRPGASRGQACVADKRAQEALDGGVSETPFLEPGDSLRIDMKGAGGQSLFGTIELSVVGSDVLEPAADTTPTPAGGHP